MAFSPTSNGILPSQTALIIDTKLADDPRNAFIDPNNSIRWISCDQPSLDLVEPRCSWQIWTTAKRTDQAINTSHSKGLFFMVGGIFMQDLHIGYTKPLYTPYSALNY
jgi:hypothetical protein